MANVAATRTITRRSGRIKSQIIHSLYIYSHPTFGFATARPPLNAEFCVCPAPWAFGNASSSLRCAHYSAADVLAIVHLHRFATHRASLPWSDEGHEEPYPKPALPSLSSISSPVSDSVPPTPGHVLGPVDKPPCVGGLYHIAGRLAVSVIIGTSFMNHHVRGIMCMGGEIQLTRATIPILSGHHERKPYIEAPFSADEPPGDTSPRRKEEKFNCSQTLKDETPSLMAKRLNTLIKLRANRAATATERGNSLDLSVYTSHVQQTQPICCGVSSQHFNAPEDFENELVTTMRSSPKQKATGPDGIANEMLQLCPELSGKVLYDLWKPCGQLAYIPTSWREGTLFPQHRKGSHHDPDHYRGLTLLSHARKTISATINRLVLIYVVFHKYQHGFTK